MEKATLRVFRRPGQPRCSGVLLTGAVQSYIRAHSALEECFSLFHLSNDSYTLIFLPVQLAVQPECTLDVVVGLEVRVHCGLLLPLCEVFESWKHRECTEVDCYRTCEQETGQAIWLAEANKGLNS